MKWIVIVSLLLNAALVGFIAGHEGRGGFRQPGGPFAALQRRDGPGATRPNADNATREALRAAFEAERPAMEKATQDAIEARNRSVALITAETVDAPALDDSLSQMRTHSIEALAAFHRALRAAALKLDVQHRRGLGRLLERQRNDAPMGALGPPARVGGDMGPGMGPPPGPPPGSGP